MAEEEILSPDIASIAEPEPSPAPQLVISAPAPVPAPVEVPTYSGPTVSPSLVLGDVNAALMRSLNNKTVDWMALLALLLGICAAMCALRVGSRVLKEFGIDACWVKREPSSQCLLGVPTTSPHRLSKLTSIQRTEQVAIEQATVDIPWLRAICEHGQCQHFASCSIQYSVARSSKVGILHQARLNTNRMDAHGRGRGVKGVAVGVSSVYKERDAIACVVRLDCRACSMFGGR